MIDEAEIIRDEEFFARQQAQLNSPYQIARHAAAIERRRIIGEAKQDAYEAKEKEKQAKLDAKVEWLMERRLSREERSARNKAKRKALVADRQRRKQQAWTPEERAAWNEKQRMYYRIRRAKVEAEVRQRVALRAIPDPVIDKDEAARVSAWIKTI